MPRLVNLYKDALIAGRARLADENLLVVIILASYRAIIHESSVFKLCIDKTVLIRYEQRFFLKCMQLCVLLRYVKVSAFSKKLTASSRKIKLLLFTLDLD